LRVVYKVNSSAVHAFVDDEKVGQVMVPDVELHWAEGVYVRIAGIAGVETKEEFRRMGIASRMMEEAKRLALRRGYPCSAVSTNLGNVARRLYSKAGYVTVCKPGRFEKRLERRAQEHKVDVRGYRSGDERELIRIFEELYVRFFGWRRKTPQRWMEMRKETESIFIAEDDGEVQGWSACFRQWVGLVSELYVRPSRRRKEIARALLHTLENHLLSRGVDVAHFWLSPQDEFSAELLVEEGYRFTEQRVLKVCILDLGGLLDALVPLFNLRLKGAPRWKGVIRLRTPVQEGLLRVDDVVSVEERGTADVKVFMPQDVLVRILCGAVAPWEAYLEGLLSVEPKVDERVMSILNALFPSVPWHHPADDLW